MIWFAFSWSIISLEYTNINKPFIFHVYFSSGKLSHKFKNCFVSFYIYMMIFNLFYQLSKIQIGFESINYKNSFISGWIYNNYRSIHLRQRLMYSSCCSFPPFFLSFFLPPSLSLFPCLCPPPEGAGSLLHEAQRTQWRAEKREAEKRESLCSVGRGCCATN